MKLWRGQPDHNHWRKPFTNRQLANVWLGFSAFVILLALLEWRNPKLPPFSGRYSWLYSSLYNINNSSGILIFYIAIAVILMFFGISKWLKK